MLPAASFKVIVSLASSLRRCFKARLIGLRFFLGMPIWSFVHLFCFSVVVVRASRRRDAALGTDTVPATVAVTGSSAITFTETALSRIESLRLSHFAFGARLSGAAGVGHWPCAEAFVVQPSCVSSP